MPAAIRESNGAIIPGKDMPRAHRKKTKVKPEKVVGSRGKLKIGPSIILPYTGYLDVGKEGGIYLVPALTPKLAAPLLKRTPKGQRGLRVSHMRSIGNDMSASRFLWNGDVIRFDGLGRLIDGQHRLSACVLTKTTMRDVLVAVVMKPGNIASIDEGARRNIRDRRAVLEKLTLDYSVIASITYEDGPNWTRHNRHGVSTAETDDIIDACDFAPQAQAIYQQAKQTYGHMDSALAAVAIRCMRRSKRQAERFFTALAENTHILDDKECKQLRAACNHMMTMSHRGDGVVHDGDHRRRRTKTTAMLIQAWNAYRESKPLPIPWRYNAATPILKVI